MYMCTERLFYIFIYFTRCLVPLLVFSFRLKRTEMIKKNQNYHYWTHSLAYAYSLTHTETTATLVCQKTHIKTWHPLHYLFITFLFEFFLYFIILKKSSNKIKYSVSLVVCGQSAENAHSVEIFFCLKNYHDNSQMLMLTLKPSSNTSIIIPWEKMY